MSYFVHEYSDKQFETYEECRDDLLIELEEEDIANHFDFTKPEILHKFLQRKTNEDFIQWLSIEVDNAVEFALAELITEYEEGEVK